MLTMAISKTREQLTSLPTLLNNSNDTIAVTNRGKPIMALMSWDLYETISETLDILSDPVLIKQLNKSIKEAEEEKLIPLEQIEKKYC